MRVRNLRRVRNISSYTKSLSGFGGYPIFPGGPEFAEEWSYNDFGGNAGWLANSGAVGRVGVTLRRLDGAVATRAGTIYSKLLALDFNHPNIKQAEEIVSELATFISDVDKKSKQADVFGTRSVETERARIESMNRITELVTRLSRIEIPAPPQQPAYTPQSNTSSLATNLARNVIQNQPSGTISAGGGSSSVITGGGGLPSWLPFAVGGGAILLMVGGFFLTGKKGGGSSASAIPPAGMKGWR